MLGEKVPLFHTVSQTIHPDGKKGNTQKRQCCHHLVKELYDQEGEKIEVSAGSLWQHLCLLSGCHSAEYDKAFRHWFYL